jgi:hypothetical protein
VFDISVQLKSMRLGETGDADRLMGASGSAGGATGSPPQAEMDEERPAAPRVPAVREAFLRNSRRLTSGWDIEDSLVP